MNFKFAFIMSMAVMVSGVTHAAEKKVVIPKYKFDKIAHLSCKEAWHEADKSVDKAFGMIEVMTVYLLKQRQQSFPDNLDVGRQFGEAIDKRCKADPDQLMLASVDAALRDVIKP